MKPSSLGNLFASPLPPLRVDDASLLESFVTHIPVDPSPISHGLFKLKVNQITTVSG